MMKKDLKDIHVTVPSPLEKVRVRLKICGMKYENNITEVATLQPDYLGFIFYEKSARFFDRAIPPLPESIKTVGVFVNASIDDIFDTVTKHDLHAVQLHGEETPEFCDALNERLTKHHRTSNDGINAFSGLIKVFSMNDDFNFEVLQPYEEVCNYFLFDTKGEFPGGNGYTFNWKLLNDYPSTKPYFLSGGIGLDEVDNLQDFLQIQSRNGRDHLCHAIDLNSKFEIEAGLKDPKKIEAFKNKLIQDLSGFLET